MSASPQPDRPNEEARLLRLWFGLSPISKRLIAFGGLLLLVMAGAVGVTVWDLRRTALDDARQHLSVLGIAIAEQTTRSIQAVDVTLVEMRRDLGAQAIETPDAFRAAMASEAVQAQLRRRDENLPQADAFTVIGADGTLINTSRTWPVPATDVSDRDYFKYALAHDDPRAFVTEPVQNRVNGSWTIYVARRVTSRSGRFLGLLLGGLDLSYFRDFYQALASGSGTSVGLLDGNGMVLSFYPPFASTGVRLPPASPWYGLVARRRPDWFEGKGIGGSGTRLVSVHPLADYPFVVTLSVSEHDALAHWRQAAWLAVAGTASAVLCVLLLLRALGLQLRRLERSERSLEQSRRQLAEESAAFATTLEHLEQGIVMIGPDRTIAVCNRRAITMLDLPETLLERRPTFEQIVEYQNAIGEFPAGDGLTWIGRDVLANPMSYERRRPNGRILEVHTVKLENGGLVRTYTDVTERRRSEEKVRFFAHHDDLTKLVNRVVFQQRLQEAIEQANQSRRSLAVLYLDLDRFKLVNDTRGHAVGDKLLMQVATRLRSAVRAEDTVARMGGDEFAIIQPSIEQAHASGRLAERILDVVARPYVIEGAQCSVGVSIGIAHYPEHAGNADDLLRNADTALYRAKADGRGTFCVFVAEMDARQQELFRLEHELGAAIAAQEFEIEYQPLVELDTGRIVCCEALLRWRHPRRGLIGPAEFIGLAESSGLIVPIGRWALQAACTDAATWPEDVSVAVNLSPVQFSHETLTEDLATLAGRSGLSLSRLVLEVTEGLLLGEGATVLATMSQLRTLGVRFSLDDFGTAHAGLSYLRRFPFDAIKIDRSFVQDVVDQPGARAIVEAVLGIGRALGLRVIAEGVETEAHLAQLQKLGCGTVQGFLTGSPVPASAILAKLRRAPGGATE